MHLKSLALIRILCRREEDAAAQLASDPHFLRQVQAACNGGASASAQPTSGKPHITHYPFSVQPTSACCSGQLDGGVASLVCAIQVPVTNLMSATEGTTPHQPRWCQPKTLWTYDQHLLFIPVLKRVFTSLLTYAVNNQPVQPVIQDS